ncbi:hypothetical protein Agub_g13198, partial [Astrephomene gubernaculifera]
SPPRPPSAGRFEPPPPALSLRRTPGRTTNTAQAALLDAREQPQQPPQQGQQQGQSHSAAAAETTATPSSSSSSSAAASAAVPEVPQQQQQAEQEQQEKERAALRAAAAAAVAASEVTPGSVVAGREHWMVITVPEQPVAGAPLRVLFNRQQSEKLRQRPHILLQYGFNHWELQPPASEPSASASPAQLAPVEGVPRGEGVDFWGATVQVPPDSYEVNFILHDGAGAYENNSGLDFTFPAAGGLTYEAWVDSAAERAVARELARREAEARAAEEARVRAHQTMLAEAEEWGRRQAEELRANLTTLQSGATTRLTRPDTGATVFRVLSLTSSGGSSGSSSSGSTATATTAAPSASAAGPPAPPRAGERLLLQYNRKAGPMGRFPVPAG